MNFKLLFILGILLVAPQAFAALDCPEILTRDGALVFPRPETVTQSYTLGVDDKEVGHQFEDNAGASKFVLYSEFDTNSLRCLESAGATQAARVIYEKSLLIVIYTLFSDHVDYVVINSKAGPDDIFHFTTSVRDHNARVDNLYFNKKSMFDDLTEIIEHRIAFKSQ